MAIAGFGVNVAVPAPVPVAVIVTGEPTLAPLTAH
jgi:hypothetical protein